MALPEIDNIRVSVVIPTCNRKVRLLALLQHLDRSIYPVAEVLIVDSGEEQPAREELSAFTNLPVRYIRSEKSVCIQRNTGIREAISPWIFLCDDDMEVPPDYLQKLTAFAAANPGAGAISGAWLERVGGEWKATHPERSTTVLTWKYIFGLSVWGEIELAGKGFLSSRLRNYYQRRGNHISKAGWPVITKFSGDYFVAPVYSLGASLVKKEWLIDSPYDEVLDPHGIGDNYGVSAGFPRHEIIIVNSAQVHHHEEAANRLKNPLQYYRRILAVDYFVKTKPALKHARRFWLFWSLFGNLIGFIRRGDGTLIRATLKAMMKISTNNNPYYKAMRKNRKVEKPVL